MSESYVNSIQKLHEDLSARYKQTQDYLNQVVANIKQLKAERKKVTAVLAELNGGLQGYGESLRVIKELQKSEAPLEQCVAEAVAEHVVTE